MCQQRFNQRAAPFGIIFKCKFICMSDLMNICHNINLGNWYHRQFGVVVYRLLSPPHAINIEYNFSVVAFSFDCLDRNLTHTQNTRPHTQITPRDKSMSFLFSPCSCVDCPPMVRCMAADHHVCFAAIDRSIGSSSSSIYWLGILNLFFCCFFASSFCYTQFFFL